MPAPRGAILTDRDRGLLAFAAIARYVSADQVHRLFFDGSSKKQTYRRLAKLCQPGAKPGEGACLRRLQYRRADGAPVPVWALAPFGRSIAEREVPWLGSPAATDIGARFLEHTLVLNDVLAGMIQRLRASTTAPLADLPFRWHPENDDALSFQLLDPRTREWQRAALKPDAVLTVPARRRRLFLEAETGTQSIATANPERTGAIVAKLARYRTFFTVPAEGSSVTWYQRAFVDGCEPRLVFLVHSDRRRRKVEGAIRSALGRLPPREFKVLVLTFEEAPRALAPYVTQGVLPGTGRNRPERILTVDETLLPLVRDAYNAFAESYNATRRVIADHNARGGQQLQLPPAPREAMGFVRDFLGRLLASSSRADAGAARTTGT
jgi:hypothetical protein